MVTVASTQFRNFHPFGERIANLDYRFRTLSQKIALIGAYASAESKPEVDEQVLESVHENISGSALKLTDAIKFAKSQLKIIRPQLRVAFVVLKEKVETLHPEITRAREMLSVGNLNAALVLIANIEREAIIPIEESTETLLRAVRGHFKRSQFSVNAAAEVLAHDVYEYTFKRLLEGPALEATPTPLPPMFCVGEDMTDAISWYSTRERLATMGTYIPLSLIPLPNNTANQPWNMVKAFYPIARQLQKDMNISVEIRNLIQRLAIWNGCSQESAQLFSIWSNTICNEIMACIIGGPSYVGVQIESLAYAEQEVLAFNETPEGIPAYLRWATQLATLREARYLAEADNYQALVDGLYGPAEFICRHIPQGTQLAELLRFTPLLVKSVLEQPLRTLRETRIIECLPVYDSAAHNEARALSDQICLELTQPFSSNGASAVDSEDNKPSKPASKRAWMTASTSARVLAAATRLAFERVGIRAEIPHQFAAQCYGAWCERLEGLSLPKSSALAKDLTSQEIQRLARQRRASSHQHLSGSKNQSLW